MVVPTPDVSLVRDPGYVPSEGELWERICDDERLVRLTFVQRLNGDTVLGLQLRHWPLPKPFTFSASTRAGALLQAVRRLNELPPLDREPEGPH
jgi:hypothetical protein